MTTLTFTEDLNESADMHPVYSYETAAQFHQPLRAPEAVWETTYETCYLGFVVSTPYIPTVIHVEIATKENLRDAWLLLALYTYPMQPDLMYMARDTPREYFKKTQERVIEIPPEHSWKRTVVKRGLLTAGRYVFEQAVYGVAPSDCILVIMQLVGYSGYGLEFPSYRYNMDWVKGWIEVLGCSNLETEVRYPKYSEPVESLPFTLVVKNTGTCAGRYLFAGKEYLINSAKSLDISQSLSFVTTTPKTFERRSERLFAVSAPKPKETLPSLGVVQTSVATGVIEPVRFLSIEEGRLFLKGDQPAGVEISYKGVLLGDNIKTKDTPTGVPSLPLAGSVQPAGELEVTFNRLDVARLEFSEAVQVMEYGSIRGRAKEYELTKPPVLPFYASRVNSGLPMPGVTKAGPLSDWLPSPPFKAGQFSLPLPKKVARGE